MEDQNQPVRRRRHRHNRQEVIDQELSVPEGSSDEPKPPRSRTRTRSSKNGSEANGENPDQPVVSTRIQAKSIRRREQKIMTRKSHSIMESEFLAKREVVDRKMLIQSDGFQYQIAVIEDGILVEFYITKTTDVSIVANIYMGIVQNVLPAMESAFIDIGVSRNSILYAGEVAWDAFQLEGKPRMIENSLKEGDKVIVQVTKDAVAAKGPRLTSQITVPGKFLVLVPSGGITGISRKIAPKERERLKRIVERISNPNMGVIIRTAADGASEAELQADLDDLIETYKQIFALYEKSRKRKTPEKLYEDASTQIRVIRDMFNDSFNELITGDQPSYELVQDYLNKSAPKFLPKVKQWEELRDNPDQGLFEHYNIEDQVYKAMNRKVLLPSGGSLVIDHTEAMTVIDVNTGRNTGRGTMEETITQNNLEAAQEIVNQLRLRDVGGIIVIDFVDMMLKANQNKVLTRFIECLSRDRTRHQVSELTSLGLIQMTRKRRGPGLAHQMNVVCKECEGRGFSAAKVYVLGTKDPEKIQRYEETKKVVIPDQKRAKAAAQIAEASSM